MTNPGDAVPAPEGVAPELQFSSQPVDVETEPLFSIDGTVYSIPKRIPASKTLDILETVAERGELAAAVALFKAVMGDAAYAAAKGCPGIDDKGLAALLRVVQDKAMGQLKQLQGE